MKFSGNVKFNNCELHGDEALKARIAELEAEVERLRRDAGDLAHYCDLIAPMLAETHPGKAEALQERYMKLADVVEPETYKAEQEEK